MYFYIQKHPFSMGLSSQHSSAVLSPQLCGDVMVEESTSKNLQKQQEAVQERRLVANAEESSPPPPLPSRAWSTGNKELQEDG